MSEAAADPDLHAILGMEAAARVDAEPSVELEQDVPAKRALDGEGAAGVTIAIDGPEAGAPAVEVQRSDGLSPAPHGTADGGERAGHPVADEGERNWTGITRSKR